MSCDRQASFPERKFLRDKLTHRKSTEKKNKKTNSKKRKKELLTLSHTHSAEIRIDFLKESQEY